MKNKEKQELKSSGVLVLLSLMGLSLAIIATPWNRQEEDPHVETAHKKAMAVGYQVAQIYREAAASTLHSSKKAGRNPASIADGGEISLDNVRVTGTMGTDPWGQPFHYRILSSEKSGHVRVLIWSSGPNKKVETAYLGNDKVPIKEQPVYVGDDMGVLLSVAQN